MKITKDDFDQWINSEVTREVFKILEERKLKIAHALAQGAMAGTDYGYGLSCGRYAEINDLLEMEFEDMKFDIQKDKGI